MSESDPVTAQKEPCAYSNYGVAVRVTLHQRIKQRLCGDGAVPSSLWPCSLYCETLGWGLPLMLLLLPVVLQGGPDRLSRHDIAMAVAQHCGLDSKAVLTANSADIKRCV